MFDANLVTAMCAVLGCVGGFIMWLRNILNNRMPWADFKVQSYLGSATIKKIVITPKRTLFAYQIEGIVSSYPLFESASGVDYLGKGKPCFHNEISQKSFNLVIPSIHQTMEYEISFEFYVNLKDYNQCFYPIRLLLKSDYFPFKMGRRIDIPVK